MKKILIFMLDSNWGGPHQIAASNYFCLQKCGYETLIVFSNDDGNAVQNYKRLGIPTIQLSVHRFRRYPTIFGLVTYNLINLVGIFRDVGNLRSLIRETEADAVQVSGVMAIQGGIAAWLERKPIVWQLLGLLTPRPIKALYLPFIVHASSVVMSVGREVAERHKLSADRVKRLIYFIPPVDLSNFKPDEDQGASVRSSLGYSNKDFIVGIVGNRNPVKGHDFFVRVAALALQRGLPFKFVIVGHETAGSKQYYKKHVVDLADQLGLRKEKVLEFIAPSRPIFEYMNMFDAFVLSSLSEGMPTVLLEAMAAGLPVITHDVGAVKEVINSSTGRIVEIGDVERICDYLEELWRNPSLSRALGREARALAELKFGIGQSISAHEEAYRACMGS